MLNVSLILASFRLVSTSVIRLYLWLTALSLFQGKLHKDYKTTINFSEIDSHKTTSSTKLREKTVTELKIGA